MVAYLKLIIISLRFFMNFFKLYFMQLISADATIFSKQCYVSFLPQKVEKKHPQKLLRKTQIHFFFSLMPELPKRPKQKNSCSKMWLMDQPYIKLGFGEFLHFWCTSSKFVESWVVVIKAKLFLTATIYGTVVIFTWQQ